jgi:ATP-dependent Clp protease ATP-binding subunit ClpA
MEDELKKDIVGQDDVLHEVSEVIRVSRTSLKDPRRPIGVFGFFGPSGVGKTELSRSMCKFMFHAIDDSVFIELDMSEYSEKHTVSRLFGAPPGYVGYEEGGQLTEKVRRKPFSVVVFDEIEKAHPDVWNALLQIMENGNLTDGKGRTIDFRNTIIIMTGNVGSEFYAYLDEWGSDKVKEKVNEALKGTFRPEFLNRIDVVSLFNALTKEDMKAIVDLRIGEVNSRLEKGDGINISLTSAAHEFLETAGYDPQYGARPIRRVVKKYVESPLSIKLLANEISKGDTEIVDYQNGKMEFSKLQK